MFRNLLLYPFDIVLSFTNRPQKCEYYLMFFREIHLSVQTCHGRVAATWCKATTGQTIDKSETRNCAKSHKTMSSKTTAKVTQFLYRKGRDLCYYCTISDWRTHVSALSRIYLWLSSWTLKPRRKVIFVGISVLRGWHKPAKEISLFRFCKTCPPRFLIRVYTVKRSSFGVNSLADFMETYLRWWLKLELKQLNMGVFSSCASCACFDFVFAGSSSRNRSNYGTKNEQIRRRIRKLYNAAWNQVNESSFSPQYYKVNKGKFVFFIIKFNFSYLEVEVLITIFFVWTRSWIVNLHSFVGVCIIDDQVHLLCEVLSN